MADGEREQISLPGPLRSDGEQPATNPTNPSLKVAREPFTDSECFELAGLLCPDKDFHSLSLYLGFHAAAVSRFKAANRDGSYHGTYKMLTEWKKGFLDDQQREHLSNALDRAGLISVAYQVRYGQKLEPVVAPPPCYSVQPNVPGSSNFSQPNTLLSCLPSSQPPSQPQFVLGPNPLPQNTEPSPGNDVGDIALFNISRQLTVDSFYRLGLALGYTLDQLEAFRSKHSSNIPEAGLDMFRDLKSRVGHIRKADFISFLIGSSLPSLVQFC